MARLDPDEVERYQHEGWIVPRWRLPSSRVDAMREALEELAKEQRAAGMKPSAPPVKPPKPAVQPVQPKQERP